VAELGQHPATQPAEQRAGLLVERGGAGGVLGHHRLHRAPVGHRSAHVGERGLERFVELAALARIGARGLDIDQRFARAAGLLARLAERGDRAGAVAGDGGDRVEQAIDREALRGDGRGDRIDQERHVVIDHRDPQAALAGVGFDMDQRFAGGAGVGGGEQELRGLVEHRLVARGVARQQRGFKVKAKGFAQRALRRGGDGL
jgi:hypothetical protein